MTSDIICLNWISKLPKSTSMVMKIITLFTLLSLLITTPGIGTQQDSLSGLVLDYDSGEPVPGAHVYFSGHQNGTVTGPDGTFDMTVPAGDNTLVISHIGYRDSILDIDNTGNNLSLTIHLQPLQVQSDDIIITAGRVQMHYSGIYSNSKTRTVEDHMSSISGLDMVTRANFGKDPVIRGLRDGRVNVLIDGMRLTPACVDGMDPATAYVEADNLQSIEISRGQEAYPLASTAPGGAVNFTMAQPALNTGLRASIETGYHSVSNQQMGQGAFVYGGESLAVRISGTYRNAGDLRTGEGRRIGDSGLEKGNIFTSVLYKPAENHQFNLRYIGDFAGKIGYPMLLMDTRRADAHIAGLRHTWTNPSNRINSIESNLYINRVEHWMDDYDRDVTKRDVMKNMYMPMYGETLTAGLTSELNASKNSHFLNLKFEAFSIDAFADMLMEHVNPEIRDMYLVNLGDVSQRNASISAAYQYFAGNGWILGGNVQAELGTNRLAEESALNTYRAEYPELENLEPTDIVYSIGLSAEKEITERFQTGLRISDGYRLPDHMERYGYYVYQPLDGFFYHGNPGLRTERSSQAELFFTYGNERTRLSGNTSFWVNRMDNYIAGNRYDDLFKQYGNMGLAVLTGFETDVNVQITGRWTSGASVSYVFGQHNKLDEPLPMIPPLKGTLFLQRQSDIVSLESHLRWAASQNRIAEQNSLETRTGGYALWDLFASTRITQNLTLQTGFENLLNTFYTDHLSVNSMPGAGRNIYVSLRVVL
jgi:iron complex outermembrane recepter protein